MVCSRLAIADKSNGVTRQIQKFRIWTSSDFATAASTSL